MNSYITLDGNDYKTIQDDWTPVTIIPNTTRMTLNAELDATWGSGILYLWSGTIKAEITPTGSYGSEDDLRTSLKKRQKLAFRDHYYDTSAITYNVVVQGQFEEKSFLPDWDAAENTIHISVEFLGN